MIDRVDRSPQIIPKTLSEVDVYENLVDYKAYYINHKETNTVKKIQAQNRLKPKNKENESQNIREKILCNKETGKETKELGHSDINESDKEERHYKDTK